MNKIPKSRHNPKDILFFAILNLVDISANVLSPETKTISRPNLNIKSPDFGINSPPKTHEKTPVKSKKKSKLHQIYCSTLESETGWQEINYSLLSSAARGPPGADCAPSITAPLPSNHFAFIRKQFRRRGRHGRWDPLNFRSHVVHSVRSSLSQWIVGFSSGSRIEWWIVLTVEFCRDLDTAESCAISMAALGDRGKRG